jgi:hypothetical protein
VPVCRTCAACSAACDEVEDLHPELREAIEWVLR